MKKIIMSTLIVIVVNILPVIGKPHLVISAKMIFILCSALSIWFTQPMFSFKETNENKDTDKFSVIFILTASFISVISAEIEWAYFSDHTKDITMLTITGILMMVSGILLRIWSINTLGKHFTVTVRIAQEHKLVTSGPYSLVRHPSYLGAFLAITGSAFFLNAIFTIFLSLATMSTAYYLRIKSEENLLIKYFGSVYLDYAKNKKKLIPFIW